METALGELQHFDQYKDRFADDKAARVLAASLSEGQTRVAIDALTLRQLYTKFHPDSGPLRIETFQYIEEALEEVPPI